MIDMILNLFLIFDCRGKKEKKITTKNPLVSISWLKLIWYMDLVAKTIQKRLA